MYMDILKWVYEGKYLNMKNQLDCYYQNYQFVMINQILQNQIRKQNTRKSSNARLPENVVNRCKVSTAINFKIFTKEHNTATT